MNQTISNPFGVQDQRQERGLVAIEQQRVIQEVQAAMVIAKKFPRNPVEATDRILQACSRPTLAEGALYTYNRGGSEVTGPSIRLAEALAQAWGNIQFGVRELEQRQGESVVEAFAWDVETNTKQLKIFTVPHVRPGANRQKPLDEPRDIYEVVASNGARRLRACILGVIPGDVIEAAQRQCEVTLNTYADTSPESIKRMLDIFSDEFGVTSEQIQAYLGRRADAMLPAQYVQMRKIYASLRDGMSKPSDWFKSKRENPEPETSIALAAMRGENKHVKAEGEQVEPEAPSQEAASPEQQANEQEDYVDHSGAYADHCAAIEAAASEEDWKLAYNNAWQWACETGNQEIADGIIHVAGERKAQLQATK
ncbi:hypothetical protein [Aeromonas enteropelogenes]|uniref:hypothetical protein n=2 Tax=Aeromonas enteropelogenes TaxID=29489 RepID=UPI002286A838|nr:hypothetical protein [Aeromonas enteropelogenes]MCZ0750080.1 hypothetical protein [Aeromonas enteropelogenes]